MANAKKPIVGHAVMYDLLFALTHFEAPLPESYDEFKDVVQGLFPTLLDTQFLAKSEPFKYAPQTQEDTEAGAEKKQRFGSMALGAIYKVFEEEAEAKKRFGKGTVEISFAPGHDRYRSNCNAFHEAGFDAYITGYAFAHMQRQALSSELLTGLNGRSTMWRSLYHFNVLGKDPLATPGVHVFVQGLRGKDEAFLKTATVELKLSPGDGHTALESKNVEVRWFDDSRAVVILPAAFKDALVAKLSDAGDRLEASGLKFQQLDTWLATRASGDAKAAAKKRPAECMAESDAAAAVVDAQEPAQKRART